MKIIEGDRQGASAYYPKEVLEASAPLFKAGTKVYWNHPTLTEMEERPVRDAREILGHFTEDASYDGKDLNGKIHVLESQRPRVKELAEAGLIGLSIRAEGRLQESAKGDRVLAEFTKVHSVDVVTEAGAGGKFTQVLESGVGSEKPASKSVAESHKEEESMELPKEFLEALDALVQTGKDTAAGVQSLVAAEEAKKTAAAKAEDAKDGGADDDEEDKDGKKKPAFLKAKESALSLSDLDDKLTEAELSAAGRKAVLAIYENGGDAVAAIESEKARDAEIRESLGHGFRGVGSEELTESATSISDVMFGKTK